MPKTIGIDISVLADINRTGIAVYTYGLIKSLLELNKTDNFILFGIASPARYNYLNNFEFKEYPNVTMKIYKMPAKFFRVAFIIWQTLNWPTIEQLIGKVDIFHSFNWYFPPQGSGKLVATVFDMSPILFPDYHLSKTVQMEKLRLERIKQKADLVITISENSKKDFLRFAPKRSVEVIYPALDETFLIHKKTTDSKETLKKYNIKPGYFLSVATLEPRKNIVGLINSFLESGLDNQLVLVGNEGWKSGAIAQFAKKYPDKIIVTGFAPPDDLVNIYSQAICLVYPSFYEGFGLPILEALSIGIPVITSYNSSIPEVGGKALLYIDPNDLISIKNALIKISNNKTLRKSLINLGQKQAKKFSWKIAAVKLNNLYQNL